MTSKAGLRPIAETGNGPILADWSDHGLRVLRPSTGKACGQRYIPMQPGLGLAADILARPDFLQAAGAEFVFKDRFRGARFVSDGTYLRPLGGRAIVAQRAGSKAAPAATLTLAAAAGSFVPAEVPTIPGGLCIAGQTQVRIEFVVRHTTSTATASLNVRFGTNGNSTDNRAAIIALPNTAGLEVRGDLLISIATATTANATNTLAPGGSGTNVTGDSPAPPTYIDVTQAMTASIDISGGAVGDVFDLLFYRVTLIQ